MTVWYAIPSKRPAADAQRCIDHWRRQGYSTAVFRDASEEVIDCDLLLSGDYHGYAAAVNLLCQEIIQRDSEASWIVTGGDDIEPDLQFRAERIGVECGGHFKGTFGVMQPTGDRWGEHHGGAYIDRVCGSPWMGREFCERMYGGNGPLCESYTHMFVDEELQRVAMKLNVLWQRRDITQLHRHWGRRPDDGVGSSAGMPAFLRDANSPGHWTRYKAIFEGRKALGFPGHEPSPHLNEVMA
jgi:hypothetical protein